MESEPDLNPSFVKLKNLEYISCIKNYFPISEIKIMIHIIKGYKENALSYE